MKEKTTWKVIYSNSARKQLEKMPASIQVQVDLLANEIEKAGPIRRNWSHFGALKKGPRIPLNAYHCHIKNGKPTYVVCWMIDKKQIKIIEIYYVGTHENAPY